MRSLSYISLLLKFPCVGRSQFLLNPMAFVINEISILTKWCTSFMDCPFCIPTLFSRYNDRIRLKNPEISLMKADLSAAFKNELGLLKATKLPASDDFTNANLCWKTRRLTFVSKLVVPEITGTTLNSFPVMFLPEGKICQNLGCITATFYIFRGLNEIVFLCGTMQLLQSN